MDRLPFYFSKFSKLNTAKVNGLPAPHKPVLLLAIIRGFEKGEIESNRIYILPELIASFKDLWHQLVTQPFFTPNFSLPFYHLQSDGFWHIQTIIGRELLLTTSRSIKSFAHLKEVVDFAYLDEELYQLLTQSKSRNLLQQALLARYFPHTPRVSAENKLVQEVIQQILNESPETYRTRAKEFDEEEVFIRGGIFKKEIPRIYNNTCCISGMRIIADRQVQMVDACHIVPFSESGDDTIGNGISLCPNLHRAFDRGLLTITEDYRVWVRNFHEGDMVYSIRQFDGRAILLPTERKYYPKTENLKAHQRRFGFV